MYEGILGSCPWAKWDPFSSYCIFLQYFQLMLLIPPMFRWPYNVGQVGALIRFLPRSPDRWWILQSMSALDLFNDCSDCGETFQNAKYLPNLCALSAISVSIFFRPLPPHTHTYMRAHAQTERERGRRGWRGRQRGRKEGKRERERGEREIESERGEREGGRGGESARERYV